MAETVIKIENVKKKYRLGTIGGGTLTADIQSWWARKKGKEDPNTKIGTDMSKVGDDFYALKGIDLEVHKGEAVGIIGANGAGKSTLLKLLSRVTAPTEGTIKINGRIASMLEVGTGFHPELTGRENIYMNGAILGMTRSEIDSKIEEIIDFSECRQFIDTPVKRYSSGMYVKLAFAVAAHLDAEIMIMDEVLAVGDVNFQNKCLSKISELVNAGKTALYVSHNMSTIQKLCDRVVVLSKGEKIYDGEVDQGIRRYFGREFDYSVKYDLVNAPRFDGNTNSIELKEFEFINRDTPTFFMGENVLCRLQLEFKDNIGPQTIKLIIRYFDGTVVGVYLLRNLKPGKAGQKKNIFFEMPMSTLAPGSYEFRIACIELVDNGNEVGHDTLRYFGKFNVVENNNILEGFRWVQSTYGHGYLGSLSLKKEAEIND